MQKSGSQKALKVISIILIVIAVLGIVLTAAIFAAANMPEVKEQLNAQMMSYGYDASQVGMAITVIAVIMLVSSLIDLLIGIFGLRGANDPSKIGVFWVLCIIGIIVSALAICSNLAQGQTSNMPSNLISLIVDAILLLLANNIKSQTKNA
ncbi:MAG: hypothetical protein Q4E12_01945 [Coriobacteriia bacterium]|nr:hypothetical protein [Coriobacteriia bacterium]